jgi:hypothetical protein
MSELQAHYARAVARAKQVLHRGDKVRLITHGGGQATYRMTGWGGPDENWIVSASTDELHPYNVVRVNGARVSFRDEGSHD